MGERSGKEVNGEVALDRLMKLVASVLGEEDEETRKRQLDHIKTELDKLRFPPFEQVYKGTDKARNEGSM